MSVDSVLSKLTQLKKEEANLKKQEGKLEADAAKKRSDAQAKKNAALRTSSASSVKSYTAAAVKLDKEAGALTVRAAAVSKKLSDNANKQRQENSNLERARKAEVSVQDRADKKRRDDEKKHAREVARIAKPTVKYIHEVRHIPAPKPEQLRVVYLTANPRILDEDQDGELIVTRIRVDKEIRDVRAEVKSALHRDSIEIDHWPAATAMDLLNSLNDKRPHVIHFSGHGGGGFLEFDDGQLNDPQGFDVSFEHLAQALGATTTPPVVLVLNACDTLEGADVLLAAVPVVIATTTSISDQAASLFATVFYRAIASGQSVGAAVGQARVMINMLAGGGGDVIASLTREDVDLDGLVLVQIPASGSMD
ncbi:CHAT domain-containing protein [Streptomyces sp. STR69]|uniref:CHAT domain-containing protein n=1 Tax=Streptomyces sp. STR69 TaxID=1796942 RepID=UPI0021C9FDAA|nr:CHAT domain-containing protein [Streptomyces sp. STR69]